MEISRKEFPFEVVHIIRHITEAHFVAIDLELSGIAPRVQGGNGGAKRSLQEVYQEAKEAAEKYAVLQFGLTIVKEDIEHGQYVFRPYNFYISPLLRERFKVQRTWSSQSGAMEFLAKHGFRHEAPYTEGVPYMSREEEDSARAIFAKEKPGRMDLRDIEIEESDSDTQAFLDSVRTALGRWLSQGEDREDFLNFPEPASQSNDGAMDQVNKIDNYRIRLIHQLARNEFPNVRVAGRRTWVQFTIMNQRADEANQREHQERFERNISDAIEFRWLIEAVVGGDITRMPAESLQQATRSDVAVESQQPIRDFAKNLQARISLQPKVLIGHNLFLDLLNLYSCFLGQLPDRVQDFQKIIHELFPMIIDTKYLASRDSKLSYFSSDLQSVARRVDAQVRPVISIAEGFDRYESSEKAFDHEAGYDSLLTADVAAKLSVKIHTGGKVTKVDDAEERVWERTIPLQDRTVTPEPSLARITAADPVATTPRSARGSTGSEPASGTITPQPANWKAMNLQEFGRIKSLFSHTNRFDTLADQSVELEGENNGERVRACSSSSPQGRREVARTKGTEGVSMPDFVSLVQEKVNMGGLMPRFDSHFWRVHGNKLQVNSCKEGIFDLNP